MHNNLRFVGLDVHKDSITIAVAEQHGEPKVLQRIPNDVGRVIKELRKLEKASILKVCYEAGPLGFGLQRALQAAKIDCIIVAPSLIPVRSGERIKTDRRDACKLAHFLRSGDLTPIWVPDEQTEAIRDLERSREDARLAEGAEGRMRGAGCCQRGEEFPLAPAMKPRQQDAVHCGRAGEPPFICCTSSTFP